MNIENTVKLLKLLNADKIKVRGDGWVMCSCLFAKWFHKNKTDNHPSFGISSGNKSCYNCFSCSRRGVIYMLPSVLTMLTGKDYPEVRKFISDNEKTNLEDYDSDYKPKTIIPISNTVLEMFEVPKSMVVQLDLNLIADWDILYDKKERRVIFPIYDINNRLVGIRGRAMLQNDDIKYRSYTELSNSDGDAKSFGVWYGMHRELKKDKAIFLVEGERDTILLSKYVSNVWGAMGAKISKAQVNTLRNQINPLVLFFDNDEAGVIAKDYIYKMCKKLMPIYYVKDYISCKDPAELVEKNKIIKALKSIKVME